MSVDTGVQTYAELLDEAFDGKVAAWAAQAENDHRFPRPLLEHLGEAGVFTRKWEGRKLTELDDHFALGRHLGSLGSAAIGVGVSLHDSAIAILRRFGRNDFLTDLAQRAMTTDAVLCIGASEEQGGSDLQNSETRIFAEDGGYRVVGVKKFVSLSPIADHMFVVCRGVEDGPDTGGNVALATVPIDKVRVGAPYEKLGAGPLDTAPVTIDTWIPEEALIARPGTGLAVISWGLAHERYSVAAQIAASCEVMLGVTLARMMERTQFGKKLYDHQALRLRLADLQARVDVLSYALDGVAARGKINLRTAAALKATAANLGEEVASECLHIFGGIGYLEAETPIGRWWRDMKLARVGGGTDEVLWELVAAAMKPDTERYQQFVLSPRNRTP
ncbi:acyl-CoA/acyl-ACP dehydrogenase [Gordonia rubripertincta]|uniref:Acyl-[acyl-carrier-protein] dehydrogenase MbtN n=1 Tax=Gordonia rubripertincta TaxID=36822 RepID=A0AAW4GBD0_GORRU|nr:acyl-CoA dehydrogenase family protein [Gordonia rubripertincta]MBM7280415.1 acyl-CoA/acyl-ACP dehydrogenase [Gordonia rubripertincta]QMU22299.1 acyl-CoA/acyl-ACP dehydrogenase [Gordonia rubripertincta]